MIQLFASKVPGLNHSKGETRLLLFWGWIFERMCTVPVPPPPPLVLFPFFLPTSFRAYQLSFYPGCGMLGLGQTCRAPKIWGGSSARSAENFTPPFFYFYPQIFSGKFLPPPPPHFFLFTHPDFFEFSLQQNC